MLFEELSELTGQRNAIDGRIVDIVAEIDRGNLAGITGARSIPALIAWKTGTAPRNAETIATVAHRLAEFPRCAEGLRDRPLLTRSGRRDRRTRRRRLRRPLRAARRIRDGQPTAHRDQTRTTPRPAPRPEPQRSITKTDGEQFTTWRITLPHDEAATFDAALDSHRDALITDWKNDHTGHADGGSEQAPPFPNTVDAFMRLIEAGWDAEATPPSSRAAHHRRRASRPRVAHRGPAPGTAAHRRRAPLPDLRRHLRGLVRTPRPGRRLRSGHPHRGSPAASRPRTPRPLLRGPRLRRHPRAARPPHPRTGKTAAPPNWTTSCWSARITTGPHHRGDITITGPAQHLVVTDAAGRHTQQSITGPTPDHTPTRRRPLPRTDRRTRPMVVVPTLPTTPTTNEKLGRQPNGPPRTQPGVRNACNASE